MVNKTPELEFNEIDEFRSFLVETGRLGYFNEHERGDNCLCVVRDFSALATKEDVSPLVHLHNVDVHEHYKKKRKHALSCQRCQKAFDAMLTFEGQRYRTYFPNVTRKILDKLGNVGLGQNLHIVKLPAPASGTFSNHSRLVLATETDLYGAIDRFYREVLEPLNLNKKFSDFDVRTKGSKDSLGRTKSLCHQANSNYGDNHVSIRAISKTR